MKFNAIRVGERIEKVYVDFASPQSIKDTTGFARLYTIHTAKTNEMSDQLGFHVGGFCDDRGPGGPYQAALVAGYPSLPSDLILCRMDRNYDFLPLEEGQLNSLMLLVATGKVIPPTIELDAAEFFAKHGIDPLLPSFHFPAKTVFFEDYPNLVALVYDETTLLTDKDLEQYGRALFQLADRIIKELDEAEEEGLRVARDGSYYFRFIRQNEKAIAFIEVPGQGPSHILEAAKTLG